MSIQSKINAICYGEVLYDIFGEEKKIGGAPLNLAVRTASFGFQVSMISAVGQDENGNGVIQYLSDNHVDVVGINQIQGPETGLVNVTLDESGSATYEIRYPAAWDFITANNNALEQVKNADVFFFGSLICRNDISKNTLIQLLKLNPKMLKVFDVNLRKPFYDGKLIRELMQHADFIKFNDEEILEIAQQMGFQSENLNSVIEFVVKETGAKSICVTRGKHGSLLFWKGKIYQHNGYPVKVADTVGAGDSFLASLIYQLMTDGDAKKALDFASAVGAIVASKHGANPEILLSEIQELMA